MTTGPGNHGLGLVLYIILVSGCPGHSQGHPQRDTYRDTHRDTHRNGIELDANHR
jgi:hypothetical protein